MTGETGTTFRATANQFAVYHRLMSPNPIVGLMQSRKAVVVLLTMAGLFALTFIGKLHPDALLDYLKIIIPVWLASQGVEDAAEKWNAPGVPSLPPKPLRAPQRPSIRVGALATRWHPLSSLESNARCRHRMRIGDSASATQSAMSTASGMVHPATRSRLFHLLRSGVAIVCGYGVPSVSVFLKVNRAVK